MLNIGVFGAGHLGKIHLKLLKESKHYNLVGFYDSDLKNAKLVSNEFNYMLFESPISLILPEPLTAPDKIRSVPVAKDTSTIGIPAKVISLDIVIG